MTAALAISLPGGRVLLGWWRELSGLKPHRLWFAHLLLNRIEALVEVAAPAPLAALGQALLPLLARQGTPHETAALAAELHLDRGLLVVLLGELARAGLIRRAEQGPPEAWVAAEGQASAPATAITRLERRSFFFAADNTPLFLPLASQAVTPVPAPEGPACSLATLESCVGQSAEWKGAHGFPRDVMRVLHLPAESPEAGWRGVPLARWEQTLVLLVEKTAGGEVLGFPVKVDGWNLGREAVLSVPGGAEVLSPLLHEVGLEAWKPSWQAWCQQRNLPATEAEGCKLELVGHRVKVHAPARLIERLRAARSDALKGEAWLLAGAGRVRGMAMLDLGETS